MDGWKEVMEVHSIANKRLTKIYSAGFASLMCLYLKSPYFFKINLSSLCMVVTTVIVFYKLSSKEVGVGGRGKVALLLSRFNHLLLFCVCL